MLAVPNDNNQVSQRGCRKRRVLVSRFILILKIFNTISNGGMEEDSNEMHIEVIADKEYKKMQSGPFRQCHKRLNGHPGAKSLYYEIGGMGRGGGGSLGFETKIVRQSLLGTIYILYY